MRLYLDANAIIYAIESTLPVRGVVAARVGQAEAPGGAIITSRLSRLECRVKPLRDGNTALLGTYDLYFARPTLVLADISAPVIEQATDLRARYRFRTPDALHMATAIVEHADVFLTGDAVLRRCTEVRVDVV